MKKYSTDGWMQNQLEILVGFDGRFWVVFLFSREVIPARGGGKMPKVFETVPAAKSRLPALL
jgi:hypothetical protein